MSLDEIIRKRQELIFTEIKKVCEDLRKSGMHPIEIGSALIMRGSLILRMALEDDKDFDLAMKSAAHAGITGALYKKEKEK